MMEWDSKPEDKRIEDTHPRDYVPMEVKRFVVSWLTKQDFVCLMWCCVYH